MRDARRPAPVVRALSGHGPSHGPSQGRALAWQYQRPPDSRREQRVVLLRAHLQSANRLPSMAFTWPRQSARAAIPVVAWKMPVASPV
jgi:hypothetical protein